MKRTYANFMTLALACALSWCARAETVIYKVRLQLDVPRVYKNTESLGFRRIQKQRIVGFVSIDKDVDEWTLYEPEVRAYSFVNSTHVISGTKVRYADCVASDVMYRYIGNNRTGVFATPNVRFTLDLNPSYNIGADEPDNTLIITLSGHGRSERVVRGRVTGQIGCGCHAYGHISPTRTLACMVSDIVPICGTFKMKRIGSCLSICR